MYEIHKIKLDTVKFTKKLQQLREAIFLPRRCEMEKSLGTAASGSIRGLRDAAYRVSSAANGADALGIVGRDLPDLALPDERMPA